MMKAGGDFSPPLMGIKYDITYPSTRISHMNPLGLDTLKVRYYMVVKLNL